MDVEKLIEGYRILSRFMEADKDKDLSYNRAWIDWCDANPEYQEPVRRFRDAHHMAVMDLVHAGTYKVY